MQISISDFFLLSVTMYRDRTTSSSAGWSLLVWKTCMATTCRGRIKFLINTMTAEIVVLFTNSDPDILPTISLDFGGYKSELPLMKRNH